MKTMHSIAITITAIILSAGVALGGNPELPIDLGTAGNFGILAKSGISTVPGSSVTGDMGVSPIASTAITGFSLILDSTTTFSTSDQVVGRIYAADYSAPTPAILTTAVGDMQIAYTDAAGRTLPDYTELEAGDISGLTLVPGLYTDTVGQYISLATQTITASQAGGVQFYLIQSDSAVAITGITTPAGNVVITYR